MLKQNIAIGLLLTLALAAGCGDSNTSPNPDQGQSNTIVDVAVGNDDFSILVAALTRADLVTTLQGAGPFTVFAPTNAAFEASGITLADVESMDVDDLTQILLYHVISGASVGSSAVTAGPVGPADRYAGGTADEPGRDGQDTPGAATSNGED